MNRRRLILSAAGAGLAVTGLSTTNALAALTATDDELAYANFGQATEFLLKDFYAKATAAKVATGSGTRSLARGAFNANEHATALGKLLTDAGQTAAVEDDFEFVWPAKTFATADSTAAAGLTITQALLGTYISAAASDLDRVLSHAVREHGRECRPAGRRALRARGRPDRRNIVPCCRHRGVRKRRNRGLPWLGDTS